MEQLENKSELVEEVASTVPVHMQRVIVEVAELNEKVTKLEAFLKTAPSLVSQSELDLLQNQLNYMKGYVGTLNSRLALYGI